MLLRLKKNALCVMQIVKLLNLRDIKFIWKEAAQLPLVPRHMKRIHVGLCKLS